MDIDKVFKKVMSCEDVQDIPITYIFAIISCVFEAISSGECFYNTEYD